MIKCPYCGKSHYTEGCGFSTSVYFPPVYKNGKNINPDGNITTSEAHCLECGKDFIIEVQYGKAKVSKIKQPKEQEIVTSDVSLNEDQKIMGDKTFTNFNTFVDLNLQSQKIVRTIEIEKWLDSTRFTYKGKEYVIDIDKFINDYFKEKK